MNVFTGKFHLKLEKYSDYLTGGPNPSIKVRTLLNFGVANLTLRIRASGYKDRVVKIAENVFPLVSPILGASIGEPIHDVGGKNGFRRLYCYNYNGDLMGSVEDFAHLFKHDIVCSKECTKGVLYARSVDKYIGFSHRGSCWFGIGDKLFDVDWFPEWSDLKLDWVVDYCKSIGCETIPTTIEEAKTYVKLRNGNDSITSVIPFRFRGGATIKTKSEALLAATNFAKYVS